MKRVIENFLKYVKMDTQSSEESTDMPSTAKQHDLAKVLAGQLKEIGAQEITYDEKHCYVYASIPASVGCEKAPVLGFVAHMDTSPAVTGRGVKPRIVENYDGNDLVLNEEKQIVMKAADFPELASYKGKRLIVTDGTTLLGADDKAGVAEIMAMAEHLLKHKEITHGRIRIGFTPDEEVGAGADYFDVKLFGADYAYTVDGGRLGELEYENFNAAGAKVIVHGRSVHPGEAKDKMRNAILIVQEFQSLLPASENPMYTCGYEGFYHLDRLNGMVEEAEAEYIIRDHDREKFEKKKALFLQAGEFLNRKYGEGTVLIELRDSYYNMKEIIEKHMHLVDNAKEAMEELGISPMVVPIRGGTDGARLSFMGLPCPNLCTGGANFHGRFEYACADDMEKIVELLVRIAEKYSGKIKGMTVGGIGMMNPYETCPVFENENYLVRLIDAQDASDLLLVYSDEKAAPFFNSDNCGGDDFHMTLLEHVQGAIKAWLEEYERKGFVRWSIIDKNMQQAVGTIELFNRHAEDYFNDCGILRLDLRGDYERREVIFEILSLIVQPAFELFDCQMIATKIPAFASLRKLAAEDIGFISSLQKLIGHGGENYGDYFVLQKK